MFSGRTEEVVNDLQYRFRCYIFILQIKIDIDDHKDENPCEYDWKLDDDNLYGNKGYGTL